MNANPEGNREFTLFPGEGGRGVAVQRITPAEERAQVDALRRWRRRRNAAKVRAALGALDRATGAGENVMPRVLACVRAGATLGEVADTWRARFGEQPPSRAF